MKLRDFIVWRPIRRAFLKRKLTREARNSWEVIGKSATDYTKMRYKREVYMGTMIIHALENGLGERKVVIVTKPLEFSTSCDPMPRDWYTWKEWESLAQPRPVRMPRIS